MGIMFIVVAYTGPPVVMTKRGAAKVLDDYVRALVHSLPLREPNFVEELRKHDLLPEDVKAKMELLPEYPEKSKYFLNNVVQSGYFARLLMVMKNDEADNLQDLATDIENYLATCKIIAFLYLVKPVDYITIYKTNR